MRTLLSAARRAKKVGLPPGAVVFVGEERTHPVHLSVIDYDAHTLNEYAADGLDAHRPLRDTSTVSWININGLHDTELLQAVGDHFGIHPLVLEDIANTGQRPKTEDYDGYLFITVKMIQYDEAEAALRSEHVSLILGPHYLISFQEEPGDIFDPVRERIRSARGRIRSLGPDYLAYALVDVIVDHYFVVLQQLGEQSEILEDEVLEELQTDTQEKINDLRRNLIQMRRIVWPVRELLSRFEQVEAPIVSDATRPFLRDAYDHAVQVVDVAESLRDVVSGLTDLYMSAISNRMNEIMKVLTIIGTIFIPLTFIVGIYGMNFEYMPELQWRYGYFMTWAVMLVTAALLLYFFRRRDWI